MKRRNFIQQSAVAGALLTPGSATLLANSKASDNSDVPGKVKNAMLSMQRASWEQGIAAQAILEMGDADMAYLMAKEAALRQTKEGRLSVLYTDNGVTDPAASGEVVFRMAEKSGDPELAEAHQKMVAYLLKEAPRTDDGTLHHTLNSPEIWIDSIYMAPPYLCVAGHPKECIRQIEGIRKLLYDPDKNLYSHQWHDGNKALIRKDYWGVGNGWAMASMARVIDDLPAEMKAEKNLLEDYARKNIDGCLPFLRTDGLFHDVIDDGDSFIETNLSQMMAYAIFRGIKSGWLSDDYLTVALRMRQAAHSMVDEHGFVQGVCGAPFFNSPGRATEGQAFFLLMEAAHARLS